jgi:pantoate--beta-alanine ligase
MKVIENPLEIYSHLRFARAEGQSVGLVPTMGALHEGHYSLVRRSVEDCDLTVATIFVNPSQFGPNEDFSRYPRTIEADLAGLKANGTDFVFIPKKEDIYRDQHSTWVQPGDVALPLEGHFRPGHYRGVATIVLKLFNIIPASVAYFGRKDFQQLQVIRHMVEDLNVPLRIEGCETIREADGLAMSSRNRYLTAEERMQATSLSRALKKVQEAFAQGETSIASLESIMIQTLEQAPVTSIDYARVVDGASLKDISIADESSHALIAVRIGATRLIDNMPLPLESALAAQDTKSA